MALPWSGSARTVPPGTATGWYPVARSAEVGTAPVPVGAGGRAFVVVRLRPGAEVSALSARCPHRLAPMAAATVVDGRLECPYHGWQFNAEGRCTTVPSLGRDGVAPPRADLGAPWAVEERDGWIWVAPERTSSLRPPRIGGAAPQPAPVPAPPEPAGPVFGNLDPSLDAAWHPIALSGEVREGGYAQVRLLGRTWTVRRDGGELTAAPPAWGVAERLGLLWLAPGEPEDVPLELPEDDDPSVVGTWLPPVRSAAPAGPLADAFLDATHAPFVHAPFVHAPSVHAPSVHAPSVHAGSGAPAELPPPQVHLEPGGFTGVRDDWAEEPGRRRLQRRVTSVYRAPFQLLVRVDERDAGPVRTVLRLLQPEDADSTRVYTRVLLRAAGGAALPAGALAQEAAAAQVELAEDLELVARLAGAGLPLLDRDELHVPADRLGVALRRALADFAAARTRLRKSA